MKVKIVTMKSSVEAVVAVRAEKVVVGHFAIEFIPQMDWHPNYMYVMLKRAKK